MAQRFLIYLPESYRKRDLWPLVVFLHGRGERGTDPNALRNCGPLRLRIAGIVAVPQCLPSNGWEADSISEFIEHVASDYRVDRKRIYLIGYSMGGYGAWHTAVAYPKLFAGIVPISGGGDPTKASALSKVPVWAFHGAKDEVTPFTESEQMIEAIRNANGQAKLTIFPEAGHGICDQVCARSDLWQWLFAQKGSP